MVPFQKRVKIPEQKWYHFRRGSKIVHKNGTISEKGQNCQQKWYHFSQKMVKISQQKWYHFRKGSKNMNKNGTMSKECRQDFHIMLLPWDKG